MLVYEFIKQKILCYQLTRLLRIGTVMTTGLSYSLDNRKKWRLIETWNLD
ncbi:Uncharacterised protein [Streptococcus dysgalactiae subsp. dysgalactiae]|uniref:Uncharacterized protein n=1 Tax=Streptococcus dysgalactiae subsp. dysgalactiae TaxID=99822 RepID=A0A380JY05_STRDY|nr:Uncharacterised protein [Streptococcus dysgalactiae subsp. dysgalactiae]SUN50361.1 Uncharacterised protein [Streptococcus dysgalactiae subsp. dysgalactiae]SUN51577.1 Uncharacterised protein [Streptococcus dysgalactiae]VDZ40888.1 Uncharacterised protein [Streptococcus dysgalactiae subsp. dysgalactiae]